MNLDFIRADRPSFLLPVPPPPRQSSSPSCSPILFAKLLPILVASFRAQWALLDLNCQRPISVGTAGPQRPASASGLSGHRWTSTDLNRHLPIAVGTAGSENMPNKMSKDMPKRLSEDMPKECQKEGEELCQTESARKKKERQKECQKIWQKEC